MDFKQFLLERIPAGKAELLAFIKDCGFYHDATSNKIVLTGPEIPPQSLQTDGAQLLESLKAWSLETGNPVDTLVVNPGANKVEIDFDEYVKSAPSATPVATGSFLEEPLDAQPLETENEQTLISPQDVLIDPSQDNIGRSIEMSGLNQFHNPVQEPVAEANMPPEPEQNGVTGDSGAGITSLIKGVSKLFLKPVTVSGAMLNKQATKLKDWRARRPGNYAEKVSEVAGLLKHNIDAFKTDEYRQLEAKVQARGGWDRELSQEFEQHLATGNQAKNWKLITEQMDELSHYSKQAVSLNKGNEEAVMQAIDKEVSDISSLSSHVPYKMKKGEVVETLYEASEKLREFMRQLVQKIIRLITGKPTPA